MKYHAGILTGTPEWDRAGLLVLPHTPAVPIEWIYAAAGLGPRRRKKLRDMIDGSQTGEFPALGLENAVIDVVLASSNEAVRGNFRLIRSVGRGELSGLAGALYDTTMPKMLKLNGAVRLPPTPARFGLVIGSPLPVSAA